MFSRRKISERELLDLNNLKEIVKALINATLENEIEDVGISAEELEKRDERKALLEEYLRLCGTGSPGVKEYLKNYIEDLLSRDCEIDEDRINYIIPFDNHDKLSIQDKFEILILKYKKKYKDDAFKMLIKKYKFDNLRDFEEQKKFFISKEDVNKIFEEECPKLDYEDKLEILAQRIYQENYGLGVIDDIRDLNISGLSCGVSGIPESYLPGLKRTGMTQEQIDSIPKSYDSVWLYFEGKEIHLSFMTFGSYEELERVCKLAYKYNDPGQLSEAEPYKFNTTADHYRVVVFRPPFSETWILIYRKFNVNGDLKKMIVGDNAKEILALNDFILKGEQNVFILGGQGAGKTTYLKGLQNLLGMFYTSRGSELFFEMHSRMLNPNRNTLFLQDVKDVPREEALDSLKKTNGHVVIIGEAAEAKDLGYVSQVSPTSKLVMGTHHAKSMQDFIRAERNALLNIGLFNDARLAEEEAISMTHFTISLRSPLEGGQGILSIDECIPIEEEDYNMDFENIDKLDEKVNAFMKTTVQFFEKMTNRKRYKVNTILKYDIDIGRFYFPNKISEKRRKAMEESMLKEDRKSFRKFCDEVLGRDRCILDD